MQATLNIDDELFAEAERFAANQSTTLDAVVSDLLRKAVHTKPATSPTGELPKFTVSNHAKRFSTQDVQRAEDEF